MRTSARPRLPDGDCVFISDVRIVACVNAPGIAADMARLGIAPRCIPVHIAPRFRNFKKIRVSKPRRTE